MRVRWCASCARETGHKRSFGVGTVLGLLATAGALWLLLPFYPKRCVACGTR